MKNRYFYVFFMLLLFAGLISGCFFDDDDDVIVILNNDKRVITGKIIKNLTIWHTNIICTNFSILVDEDDLSSGNSAFNEKTEINPYYFALPYNNRTYIYYYDKGYRPPEGFSDAFLREEVKNRWVEIINNANGKAVYCQWEDVGPWFFEDFEYIFGSTDSGETEIRPRSESYIGEKIDKGLRYTNAGVRTATVSDFPCNGAGIDISPTAMEYLTGSRSGKITVKWRFVSEETASQADSAKQFWFKSVNRNPAPKRVPGKESSEFINIERATKCQ